METGETKTTTIDEAGSLWNVQLSVIGKAATTSAATGSKVLDLWRDEYGGTGQEKILEPPFGLSPTALAQTRDISPALSRLIEAMVTNVARFGYELRPRKDVEKPNEGAAAQEHDRIAPLFMYPNAEGESMVDMRAAIEQDYEEVGYAGMEVVPSIAGDIAELYWLPAPSFRLTCKDTFNTAFTQKVLVGDKYQPVERKRKFRRIVQIDEASQKVFFREFNDPRNIRAEDGQILTTPNDIDTANEVIVFRQARSWTPYGIPRYMPCLMDMIGSAKASYVNFMFFDNKAIPPVVITVSGGTVPEKVRRRLEQLYAKEIKGIDNYHNALIIEAEPQPLGEVEGEKFANTKIDIKPMTHFMPTDANWLGYQTHVTQSVEAQFRLPPIYSGREASYNRATAFVAARLAEQQVFKPRREQWDHTINTGILSRMEARYWEYFSKGAQTSDLIEIIRGISGIKEAISVGDLMEMSRLARNKPIDDIPPELYEETLSQHQRGGAPNLEDVEDDEQEFEKAIDRLIHIGKAYDKRKEGDS
jgi:PBSX family phage portal protein